MTHVHTISCIVLLLKCRNAKRKNMFYIKLIAKLNSYTLLIFFYKIYVWHDLYEIVPFHFSILTCLMHINDDVDDRSMMDDLW